MMMPLAKLVFLRLGNGIGKRALDCSGCKGTKKTALHEKWPSGHPGMHNVPPATLNLAGGTLWSAALFMRLFLLHLYLAGEAGRVVTEIQ